VLWYKAWLETRSRFLICLATLTLFSGIFVHHAQGLVRPELKSDFNRLLFVNQQFLVIMWVLAVVLLGMGGIVREKAVGTSSLTLALPITRGATSGCPCWNERS
jgi:ABC-2 type transport system permease protein